MAVQVNQRPVLRHLRPLRPRVGVSLQGQAQVDVVIVRGRRLAHIVIAAAQRAKVVLGGHSDAVALVRLQDREVDQILRVDDLLQDVVLQLARGLACGCAPVQRHVAAGHFGSVQRAARIQEFHIGEGIVQRIVQLVHPQAGRIADSDIGLGRPHYVHQLVQQRQHQLGGVAGGRPGHAAAARQGRQVPVIGGVRTSIGVGGGQVDLDEDLLARLVARAPVETLEDRVPRLGRRGRIGVAGQRRRHQPAGPRLVDQIIPALARGSSRAVPGRHQGVVGPDHAARRCALGHADRLVDRVRRVGDCPRLQAAHTPADAHDGQRHGQAAAPPAGLAEVAPRPADSQTGADHARQPQHETGGQRHGNPLAGVGSAAGLRHHPHQEPDQGCQPQQRPKDPQPALRPAHANNPPCLGTLAEQPGFKRAHEQLSFLETIQTKETRGLAGQSLFSAWLPRQR